METICSACPVINLPQNSKAIMTTGDYINGQSVTSQCNAGTVLEGATERTFDTTDTNPTWKFDPNNAISRLASKFSGWRKNRQKKIFFLVCSVS